MDKQFLIVWYDGDDHKFDLVTFDESHGPYEDKRRVKAFAESRDIDVDYITCIVELDKKSVNVYDNDKDVLRMLTIVEVING
jgi:hypothetical protein